MDRLNPYAKVARNASKKANEENRKRKTEAAKAKKRISKVASKELRKRRNAGRKFFNNIRKNLNDATSRAVAKE